MWLKYNAPSRYRDTSEWKPFHHDAAAMKVLGKGRFFPKSTVTEQEHYDTLCIPVQTTNGTIQISARQSKNTELYSCSLFWLREVLKSISQHTLSRCASLFFLQRCCIRACREQDSGINASTKWHNLHFWQRCQSSLATWHPSGTLEFHSISAPVTLSGTTEPAQE